MRRSASIDVPLKAMFLIVLLMGLTHCGNSAKPDGLMKSGGGTGPAVIFDPLAKPIPDIPFPSDLATIMDPTSLTGRRLNIPVEAYTETERNVRRGLNTLDGFGPYAPIWLRFNAPIDLTTVNDQTVYLIKLLPPDAGKIVPLDLGKGFFPTQFRPDSFWPHDPLASVSNMQMADDNRMDLDGDTIPEFINHYEFATNTLIIRAVIPMAEMSRYAVVVTNGVKGLDGQPVRSPFEYVNHTMQTNDLMPLKTLLPANGIALEQIAYTWSFTTESITPEWINMRDGIFYGTGPLGYLHTMFPATLEPNDLRITSDKDGNKYTLNTDWFGPMLNFLLPFIGQSYLTKMIDFRFTDYLMFGKFNSPTFFTSLDFGAPLTNDEISFDPAKLAGQVPAGTIKATWMLTVPRNEDAGLDGCQTTNHPHGCMDFEEAGAKGADNGYGFAGIDDNSDNAVDDEGEYLTVGSDDVADPSCDNTYAATADYPLHCPCVIGVSPKDYVTGACSLTQGNKILDYDLGANGVAGCVGPDDNNGFVDDITEFGWTGCDDGYTEDANSDGRLNTTPFPVILYGHGHGLGAIESIAFVSAMNRFGFAVMALDSFGHGPMDVFTRLDIEVKNIIQSGGGDLNEICDASALSTICANALGLLTMIGLDLNDDGSVDANDINGQSINQAIDTLFSAGLFNALSRQGRAYDINGDGYTDSGTVDFTANIFQTRDALRQTAMDYMMAARILDHFGSESNMDYNGDTVLDLEGDFNVDGEVDAGGDPAINTRGHYWIGSSLGGINGDVAMGVNPRILVGAPISGAGGLVDVIVRSHERSATEACVRGSAGLVIVGDYDGVPGRVTLTFNNDPAWQTFGFLYVPPNGRVRVTNLANGEARTIDSDIEGNFSISIPSDMQDWIEVFSLDDVSNPAQSVVYAKAKYHGLGAERNTSDFRRLLALAQTIVDRADPINLAGHYFTNELGAPIPGNPEKAVLIITTVGDQNVPVNTGTSLATAAGLWSLDDAQYALDRQFNMGYIPEEGLVAPIYDPEDIDDDGLECGFAMGDPRCDPLAPNLFPTAVVPVPNTNRVSATRFHYVRETGHHAFAMIGDTNHGIDYGVYMLNQVGYYFASDGTCVIDDPFELHASRMIHPGPNGILDSAVSGDDTLHTIRVFKTLGRFDCNYDFPEIQVIGPGPNWAVNSTASGDDVKLDYAQLYRGP